MKRLLKQISTAVPLIVSVCGCAAVGNTIPEDAVPLNTVEITEAFSGVKESYKGKDNPAVTATGVFRDGGEFEASWSAGGEKGEVVGEWYAENDKRCLRTTKPDGSDADLECHTIYQTGSVYTSTNDDGSVHGIHSLSPLD